MMDVINTVLGIPLGYIMYFCYWLVRDYGWAIILFTVLAKVVMFPISLSAQKNSIKMVKLQPQLEEIKINCAGNADMAAEEQMRLFKKEKYSPFVSMVPTLLQIPIILGLINVVYNPLQHLFHLSQEAITMLANCVGITDIGSGAQLQVLNAMQQTPEVFSSLQGSIPGFDQLFANVSKINLHFMGFDLSQTPSITDLSILIWIPILSGLSALLMCIVQNKINVLQREQGFLGKWGMTIFLVIFSTYFAFVVPAGIGLYWIVGNLLAIAVMYICNLVYNPRKYIDYENRSAKPKLSKEEKAAARRASKENRERSKADEKRFFAEPDKQLVFYSESSGFYKYFERFIDYITAHSDIPIHYVTSDPNDQIFHTSNDHIRPYFIDNRDMMTFMMKMDADMVVMTMPDLENYYIKRSLVRKDIEYLYLDHAMASFHLTLREGALDHYDTIFCYGPNHVAEIRAIEKEYGLPAKRLVKTGYGLLDSMLENYNAQEHRENPVKEVLIAPSWQKDNLLDLCLDPIMEQLLGKGYHLTIRPHPEYVKRFPAKMKRITEKYQDKLGQELEIQTDFSSNSTVYDADLIITDWSAIAQEFSFTTKKPSLFINTPMKVMNAEYKRIPLEPLDISLRDRIGVSVDVDKLDSLGEVVGELLSHTEDYREKVAAVVEETVYNIGHSAEAGGKYILASLAQKKQARH